MKRKEMHRKTRDYFAELYVAGMMADRGGAIYFPKRDIGSDFVASKTRESVSSIGYRFGGAARWSVKRPSRVPVVDDVQ